MILSRQIMIKLHKMYIKYTTREKILGGFTTILRLPCFLDNPQDPIHFSILKPRNHEPASKAGLKGAIKWAIKPTPLGDHTMGGPCSQWFLGYFFSEKKHPSNHKIWAKWWVPWCRFFISQSSFGKRWLQNKSAKVVQKLGVFLHQYLDVWQNQNHLIQKTIWKKQQPWSQEATK